MLAHVKCIDIQAGEAERTALVLGLCQLHQMEVGLAQVAADLFASRQNENMFQPTSWIIPRLESHSFAPMPDIIEGQRRHTTIPAKLEAVERFYKDLFTPQPWTEAAELAAQTLLC